VRHASFVVTFLIVSVLAVAQSKPGGLLTWTPPEHPGPPFGTQLRKVVVVIHLSCKDTDGKLWLSSGTGFVVGYHDPRLPKEQHFDYLVTNRHVAECRDEKGLPREVQTVSLQTNFKNGTSADQLANGNGRLSWYFPTDDSVDLAVTAIAPSPQVDIITVPLDSFFMKEDFASQNIGEGAKIVLSGYSYKFSGEPYPLPLVREGILSMIADVPLQTTLLKLGTVYLGDVHIFGGNSGSPVFISTAGIRPSGIVLDDNYRFLGVVSGFYTEDSDFNLEIATTVKGTQHANSGISMIVPADFLKDVIMNNAALKMNREAYFSTVIGQQNRSEAGPTPTKP
jgi:hypothetical protein